MFKLIVVVLSLLVSPAYAWEVEAMNKTIDQTNFQVNRGCSGTLYDLEQRLILTAAHCVESQYETKEREVIDDKGIVKKEKYRKLIDGSVTQYEFSESGQSSRTTEYRVTLKAVDASIDLAVVQVNGKLPNTQVAKFAASEPKRGEKVYVVGNPMGVLYANVTTGVVSSVQRTYGLLDFGDSPRERIMQISAGVVGGNSGGAVYNSVGELVGVPVVANRTNEVIGFAVPLDVIKAFLKTNKLEPITPYTGVQ